MTLPSHPIWPSFAPVLRVGTRLGTHLVSAFAFRRDSQAPPQAVIDRLGEMAATTAAHGCRLSLENEAGCWNATGTGRGADSPPRLGPSVAAVGPGQFRDGGGGKSLPR